MAVASFPLAIALMRRHHACRRPLVWQQWTSPEVQVGGHALKDVAKDVRAGKDAAAGCLPVILFVFRGGAVAGGRAGGGGAVLALAVVAFQVILQTGRLGASVVAMRAPVGFLS